MKINWGLFPLLAFMAVVSCFLFTYDGPHREWASWAGFIVLFVAISFSSIRYHLLRAHLRKDGLPGTATLVSATTTGVSSGNSPEISLQLTVTSEAGQTWSATVTQLFSPTALYALAPGTQFRVLYDPADPSQVVLDTPAADSHQPVRPPAGPLTPVLVAAYRELLARQQAIDQRLASSGTLAPATVLTNAPLNATMNEGQDPLVLLVLQVAPAAGPAFSVELPAPLAHDRVAFFAPGCTVYVRYDPADPRQVALISSEKPAGW